MGKVIVVGSINMDIVAFVDRHPKVGETIFGNSVKYFPGGKGSNQAVASQRLGCETYMVGQVGNDGFGEQMLNYQAKEGIDITGVSKLDGHPTGTAFITVAESSDNSIIVISGANNEWDDSFIEDLPISKEDILLAQFEVPNKVIQDAFCKAKAVGATTILNPAPVRSCSQDILLNTDILVVNEIELEALANDVVDSNNDESIFVCAEKLTKTGCGAVVVTLGEKGVRIFADSQRKRINARAVTPTDTTGAGDCFIGGLAAGLIKGYDIYKASKFGNIAASISVTQEGAASSIPTLAEVNEIFGEL